MKLLPPLAAAISTTWSFYRTRFLFNTEPGDRYRQKRFRIPIRLIHLPASLLRDRAGLRQWLAVAYCLAPLADRPTRGSTVSFSRAMESDAFCQERRRPICEICGTTLSKTACPSCGSTVSVDPAPEAALELPEPMGADQAPQLCVSLHDFLATGSFGGIRPGMSKPEVLDLSGHPADFRRGDSLADAEIWVNGRVTFWFHGETLERIGVYYILKYPVNDAIQYDPMFPESETPLEELCIFMRGTGISFSADHGTGAHREVITDSGVQIIADRNGNVTSIIVPKVEPRRRQGTAEFIT